MSSGSECIEMKEGAQLLKADDLRFHYEGVEENMAAVAFIDQGAMPDGVDWWRREKASAKSFWG